MIWFDDVHVLLFPPQAVVGVISGVLNSKNVPAFRANSKSQVCLYSTYVCSYVNIFFQCALYYRSNLYLYVPLSDCCFQLCYCVVSMYSTYVCT